MKPQEAQLSHADTRANLGFITEMHKQLVEYKYPGKKDQTTPQASQEPQGEEQGEKDDIMAGITKLIEPLTQKLDALEKEVKQPSDNQAEIDAIRAELDKLEQNG